MKLYATKMKETKPIALFRITNLLEEEGKNSIEKYLRKNLKGYNVIVVFENIEKAIELEVYNAGDAKPIDLEQLRRDLIK